MSTLVSTPKQVLGNVARFGTEVAGSVDLQGRLAYARAWYAHRDAQGMWRFAPSKFCGYEGMTAEEYVNDEPRDGRRTERQLAQWFTEVPENTSLYEELSTELGTFLASYGKAPSAKIRINVLNEVYRAEIENDDASFEQLVTDMMIAVAKRLPKAERARLRAAL